MTTSWDEFVHAHGEIIGYDLGGAFTPIEPGNSRAIRIRDAVAVQFPQYAGEAVYRPTCEPSPRYTAPENPTRE